MDDDITPMKNAFRNLNERGLIQRAKGTHGPNKSLAIPARSEPAGPADADAVRHALSHVEDVFVVDAAVGSYRGSEVLVRAVTDDAAVALFLRHLLVRTGGASTAETGSAHPIKVLHSSAGAPGLSSSVNELGATIVATGDISFEHLQEAITAATHALMATGEGEFDVLPLAANAYVDGNSGATTLEVDLSGNSSMPTALKKGSRLYGANGVVWSQGGLARLFRGAVVDEKTAAALGAPLAGDIVVGGKTVVTSFNADNVVAAPSEVCGICTLLALLSNATMYGCLLPVAHVSLFVAFNASHGPIREHFVVGCVFEQWEERWEKGEWGRSFVRRCSPGRGGREICCFGRQAQSENLHSVRHAPNECDWPQCAC